MSAIAPGMRVVWRGNLATVVYQRMAPPTYEKAQVYCLDVDGRPNTTIVFASQVAALEPCAASGCEWDGLTEATSGAEPGERLWLCPAHAARARELAATEQI